MGHILIFKTTKSLLNISSWWTNENIAKLVDNPRKKIFCTFIAVSL